MSTMSVFKGRFSAQTPSLTQGSIVRCILTFAMPLFLGQLLQQLYNLADAWVLGNFAPEEAFAAVSSGGSLTFLVTGFFNGVAIGGSVIISRYFGARDEENVSRAIHNNFLFGILISVLSTAVGLLLAPRLLGLINTPEEVLPYSLTYFQIYFAGVSTVILYNMCMAIMRSLGDSLHPLYYLAVSSLLNVALDLLFVAVLPPETLMGLVAADIPPELKLGAAKVAGAAIATVLTQGISVALCLLRMCRVPDYTRLDFRKLHLHRDIMPQVIRQGLPTGVQNAVISIGNLVIQSNINSFKEHAMAGQGAYARIEGVVFLPIMSISMALTTFISQNLGAREYDRAKRGALFGVASGVLLAEAVGLLFLRFAPDALRFFVDTEEALDYGAIHVRVAAPFYFLLAFSHCAAGVMRGCGKAIVPMISMLSFWCVVRVIYVTVALRFFPVYDTIPWAYPITWSLSSVVFLLFLLKSDWLHAFDLEKQLS